MSKKATQPKTARPKKVRASKRTTPRSSPLFVSIGCPSGIGPEVSVAAAAQLADTPCVLVGDERTIFEAAEVVGVSAARLRPFEPGPLDSGIYLLADGPKLGARDRRPGRPGKAAGAAQLSYIDTAYDWVKRTPGAALVTGPVSKEAIAHSGARGASRFRGHTEWLRERDGAAETVMAFAASRLITSLVTTHLPLSRVPRVLEPDGVAVSCIWLARLLWSLGHTRPQIAVCSLNPHAGEGELLGSEERRAIVPGIEKARRKLGRRALLIGPIGAETAYRKAYAGGFDGVVAMYHDQATIPMKLIAFGEAVNVTLGLSVVRTSVDHGTGYDIAWQGKADAEGMLSAMRLAQRLAAGVS